MLIQQLSSRRVPTFASRGQELRDLFLLPRLERTGSQSHCSKAAADNSRTAARICTKRKWLARDILARRRDGSEYSEGRQFVGAGSSCRIRMIFLHRSKN